MRLVWNACYVIFPVNECSTKTRSSTLDGPNSKFSRPELDPGGSLLKLENLTSLGAEGQGLF